MMVLARILMRILIDGMIAVMVLAILAGMTWHSNATRAQNQQRELTRAEVRRFQQQIALQSALAQVERNERGYPGRVEPNWFQGKLPVNPLVDVDHPWLEIAGPEQKGLTHPPQRVAASPVLAKFWYNPSNGIVRARVPSSLSDAGALELYNFINDANLTDLFGE
jgi:type II secretory pathway component PulJ